MAAAVVVLGGVPLGGCSWLNQGKLQQYESENERLIGDFRTERAKNSVLGERNEALSDRVAKLEDRLAAVSDSLRDPDEAEAFQEHSLEPFSADSAAPPSEVAELPPIAPRGPWRGRL